MSIYIIESESYINGYKENTILKINNNIQIAFELKNHGTNKIITEAKGISVIESSLLINKFKTIIPSDLIERLEKNEFNKAVLYRKDGVIDETTWRYEDTNPFWLIVYEHYHHNYLQGLKDNGVSFISEKGTLTLSFSKKSKIKPDSVVDNSIIMLLRLYLLHIDKDIDGISVNVNTFLKEFEKTEYKNGGVQYLFNIENFKNKITSMI